MDEYDEDSSPRLKMSLFGGGGSCLSGDAVDWSFVLLADPRIKWISSCLLGES